MAIIRGTTPTITFTFSSVEVSNIQVAYLFVQQIDQTLIEKDISAATVDENSLSWELTQEETLSLKDRSRVKIFCDWRLASGLRGRSEVFETTVDNSGKNEVI